MRKVTENEKDFLMNLGNSIARIRLAKGLTQAQLAAKINLPPATIWRYENAETGPGVLVLHRIAGALDVTLQEILDNMLDKNEKER
ncbi:MAG: helix-turn-helix domain-containing protein [Bacteroidetes bacterium]|jgi:transcriptional regulator with XRE-family HTH domain|nr:helix-turn-helix domain-containing protein [Bacteroidota bacterium]